MNKIRQAAIAITAEDATEILCRALGIEPADAPDSLPNGIEWRRASDVQRMLWIGDWMRSASYQAAEAIEIAPAQTAWIPGGEKYAHQND